MPARIAHGDRYTVANRYVHTLREPIRESGGAFAIDYVSISAKLAVRDCDRIRIFAAC